MLLNASPELCSGVSHPLSSAAQSAVGPTGAHRFPVIALLGLAEHTNPPRRVKAPLLAQLRFCYHLFVRSEGEEHVHKPTGGFQSALHPAGGPPTRVCVEANRGVTDVLQL